jgi:hypothetical protein
LDNVVVSEPEVIGDDLYDRLLSLVDPYEKKVVKKKRKTRRVKKNGNKRKTRKSK